MGTVPVGGLLVGVTLDGDPIDFETYRITLEVHDVPEPESLALFGVGLAGLALSRRRRRKRV